MQLRQLNGSTDLWFEASQKTCGSGFRVKKRRLMGEEAQKGKDEAPGLGPK